MDRFNPPSGGAINFNFTDPEYKAPEGGELRLDRLLARYAIPAGGSVNFNFTVSGYDAPNGDSVQVNLPTLRELAVSIGVPPAKVQTSGTKIFYLPVIVPGKKVNLGAKPLSFCVAPRIPSAKVKMTRDNPALAMGINVSRAKASIIGHGFNLGWASGVPRARIAIGTSFPETVAVIDVPRPISALSLHRPWSFWTADPARVQTIYLFTLTGSADGEADITIPISSCQMRRRNGSPTYMSVVVPDYDAYAPEVQARLNGEMVFYKGVRFADRSTQVQEIARVDFEPENLRMDKGPKSRSITLVGHRTVTTTDPNVVTLRGVSYRNSSGGLRRYRCEVDLWLRPGDTAVVEDEQFTVGFISYTISTRREQMEVVEAGG